MFGMVPGADPAEYLRAVKSEIKHKQELEHQEHEQQQADEQEEPQRRK